MNLRQKAQNFLRALVQSRGPKSAKRLLWNHEFSTGHWDFLDQTGDKTIQIKIAQYANGGNILDLGCGSGTTGLELSADQYKSYTGVDISDVAIQRATDRAQRVGRERTNRYLEADIFAFVPDRQYQVILFGDSIYYIPHLQINSLLRRYSRYLASDGVFVVRIHDVSGKHSRILEIIESEYEVIEKDLRPSDGSLVCVVVFRSI